MTAKGYCPVDGTGTLPSWLGVSVMTAAQIAQAAAWLETAETLIDTATSTPFLTGAITDERHPLDGPHLWLHTRPITSVQAVRVVAHLASLTSRTLTANSEYEISDAARGRLWVGPLGCSPNAYLSVDYTPVATVPAAITEATAALLADLIAAEGGATGGTPVVQERIADVAVQYANVDVSQWQPADLSPRVQQLLAPWLRPLAFA